MGYSSSEARRAWYLAHRETEIAKARVNGPKYVKRNKDYINELREKTPCADCGMYYPHYVMDFDHLGDDKTACVTSMAFRPVSLEKLKREIEKCEIVCANCHRIRTYSRRVGVA